MERLIYVALLMVGLCSCRMVDEPILEPKSKLDSIYTIAGDFYYWNKQLPEYGDFDFETYNSPELILNAFRSYSPGQVDKWSFAVRNEDWQKTLQGISGDFGLGLRFLEESLFVAYVQPNSSAGKAGLERGNKVLEINGIKAVSDKVEELNKIFLSANSLQLKVQQGGNNSSTELFRESYQIDPVLKYDSYKVDNEQIGYIHLFTFSPMASQQIEEAMGFFKEQGTEYLIVDLRYNGGGVLSVMENLANYMVCPSAVNKVMYEAIHNAIYTSFDFKSFYHQVSGAICFKKVYFITAYRTASASEVLINSLRPFMDVSTIGTTTHGKLMGMHTVKYGEYTLVPAAFKIVNSEGVHDDFKGIPPDIPMLDGVDNNWGVGEACIAAAIAAIKNENGVPNRMRRNALFVIDQGDIIDNVSVWEGAFINP